MIFNKFSQFGRLLSSPPPDSYICEYSLCSNLTGKVNHPVGGEGWLGESSASPEPLLSFFFHYDCYHFCHRYFAFFHFLATV